MSPRMLTAYERRRAERELELTRRRLALVRRFAGRADLSPMAKEQAAADAADYLTTIDVLERECSMLGTLLTENGRTGWTMARLASQNDTSEARPYQGGAR